MSHHESQKYWGCTGVSSYFWLGNFHVRNLGRWNQDVLSISKPFPVTVAKPLNVFGLTWGWLEKLRPKQTVGRIMSYLLFTMPG